MLLLRTRFALGCAVCIHMRPYVTTCTRHTSVCIHMALLHICMTILDTCFVRQERGPETDQIKTIWVAFRASWPWRIQCPMRNISEPVYGIRTQNIRQCALLGNLLVPIFCWLLPTTYLVVMTMSTVGFGDIYAHGTPQRLYAILAMVIQRAVGN